MWALEVHCQWRELRELKIVALNNDSQNQLVRSLLIPVDNWFQQQFPVSFNSLSNLLLQSPLLSPWVDKGNASLIRMFYWVSITLRACLVTTLLPSACSWGQTAQPWFEASNHLSEPTAMDETQSSRCPHPLAKGGSNLIHGCHNRRGFAKFVALF